MARTAAVVGTATATRNAVNRRQADKNVKAYSQAEAAYASRSRSMCSSNPICRTAPVRRGSAPPQDDVITQLSAWARSMPGILTEEEFAAQKAKLLEM